VRAHQKALERHKGAKDIRLGSPRYPSNARPHGDAGWDMGKSAAVIRAPASQVAGGVGMGGPPSFPAAPRASAVPRRATTITTSQWRGVEEEDEAAQAQSGGPGGVLPAFQGGSVLTFLLEDKGLVREGVPCVCMQQALRGCACNRPLKLRICSQAHSCRRSCTFLGMLPGHAAEQALWDTCAVA
jgi:hypothetical protein